MEIRRLREKRDDATTDLAWLFAALPIAALLAWLIVVAQR